jgi:hypothetical protein
MKTKQPLKKRHGRIQYVMTWVSLAVMIIAGIGLMILSHNGAVRDDPPYISMIILWLCTAGPGIFLFSLGVKKAHQLLMYEERGQKAAGDQGQASTRKQLVSSPEKQVLDFAAMARKLIRRIPENTPLEGWGKVLLKNLSKDLEIMSGVFYVKKHGRFEAVATHALMSPEEPYHFKPGEGLTGQVARDQQVSVLTSLPGDYMDVFSGLGRSKPSYLAIVPLLHKGQTVAVLECTGYRYEAGDLEGMFRILARDIMEKYSSRKK